MLQMNVQDLAKSVLAGSTEGYDGVYAYRDEWERSPTLAALFIISDVEVDDDYNDDAIPSAIAALGLWTLLTIDQFESVIRVCAKQVPSPTAEDYVAAIRHYREFDSYKDDYSCSA
jgi:hypothetical protein